MPCLARDPPHAISIFLYSREQKANITDLDHSFLKSDAKVLLLFHMYNTLSKIMTFFYQKNAAKLLIFFDICKF